MKNNLGAICQTLEQHGIIANITSAAIQENWETNHFFGSITGVKPLINKAINLFKDSEENQGIVLALCLRTIAKATLSSHSFYCLNKFSQAYSNNILAIASSNPEFFRDISIAKRCREYVEIELQQIFDDYIGETLESQNMVKIFFNESEAEALKQISLSVKAGRWEGKAGYIIGLDGTHELIKNLLKKYPSEKSNNILQACFSHLCQATTESNNYSCLKQFIHENLEFALNILKETEKKDAPNELILTFIKSTLREVLGEDHLQELLNQSQAVQRETSHRNIASRESSIKAEDDKSVKKKKLGAVFKEIKDETLKEVLPTNRSPIKQVAKEVGVLSQTNKENSASTESSLSPNSTSTTTYNSLQSSGIPLPPPLPVLNTLIFADNKISKNLGNSNKEAPTTRHSAFLADIATFNKGNLKAAIVKPLLEQEESDFVKNVLAARRLALADSTLSSSSLQSSSIPLPPSVGILNDPIVKNNKTSKSTEVDTENTNSNPSMAAPGEKRSTLLADIANFNQKKLKATIVNAPVQREENNFVKNILAAKIPTPPNSSLSNSGLSNSWR